MNPAPENTCGLSISLNLHESSPRKYMRIVHFIFFCMSHHSIPRMGESPAKTKRFDSSASAAELPTNSSRQRSEISQHLKQQNAMALYHGISLLKWHPNDSLQNLCITHGLHRTDRDAGKLPTIAPPAGHTRYPIATLNTPF